MRKILFLLLGLILFQSVAHAHDFKVLIFSKTEGFRHTSIEAGIAAIQQLGIDYDFEVDATEDATLFTFENLLQYDAVIFLSTTGNVLNEDQQAAFEQYISTGKGYVGIHAASDTEYSWPWYGELVGAYFDSHPANQTATIEVADKIHPSTSFLPDYWVRYDEWYNFNENPRGNVHVLATLDESTYSGGNMGHDHPIAWMHEYGGGRSWYTAGGHTEESYSEPLFMEHILGGIYYAVGEVTGVYEGTVDEKFQVTVLDNNPLSPMALAVLPNLDVLYIERAGNLKLRSAETGVITNAGNLSVDSGREDGLIGIVLDPDFETNSWLYLFYSPTGVVHEQRISRFDFVNNAIDMATEEIMLQIPVQRDECCHSGGDLEFDSNGNLFIATGDNTNPFESDSYTPIDERAGREPWDAQRTSSNTQSLVGKILRIHPEDDGTYTIPGGNLFTDSNDGLPEIYVMGTRNPFRMAVSPYTDELVWGEVGPDAGATSATRGPIGYDEFNRTSTAGNFGWPYCIADNQAYIDYDFATGVSGSAFDCSNLVNDSPNNTGLENIPPAEPAWLYYTYGFTPERPEFGEGDRTAIAGGFYAYDSVLTELGSFPQYYDSTLFILEWTRNWIKEVRFDSDGNMLQINPFLDDLELARPIDMQFGPDGAMYIVEWGTGFFADNEDARVIKIEYVENLGNRAPFAIATASVTSGSAPLEVNFFGNLSSDPDADFLTYSWDFDEDDVEDSSEENPTHTFTENGSYLVTLSVSDPEGETAVAQIEIVVGNSAPIVTVEYPLNGGFYEDYDIIDFKISVTDAEQGTTESGIDCDDVTSEPSIGHDDHSHGEGIIVGCEGEFPTNPHGEGSDDIFYVFNAEYTDDGGGAGAPLKGEDASLLHPKKKQAEHATEFIDLQTENTGDFLGGGLNIGYVNHNSALKFGPMNFAGIDFFTARFASLSNDAEIEVRAGSTDGPLVAKVNAMSTGDWQFYDYFTSSVTDPGGTYDDVYLVFKNATAGSGLGNINWFEVHGQGIARENADSLKGLAATYYPNADFTGTPVKRQDPMIAWNWDDETPHEDIPSDGFSVRWEGEFVAPSSAQYTITAIDENGDVEVWIGGERRIYSFITSYTMDLTEGETYDIVVEYSHSTGDASIFLEWSGPNPQNVIHADYLIPDLEALDVSNEMTNDRPVDFYLSQNYPNPFNPSTNISFSIPTSGKVKLDVFNVLGQTVQVLVDEIRNEGSHTVTFHASNYSSGVYFYRLEFDGRVISNKMLLLK